MSYKLAIIGSRTFTDYQLLCEEMAKLPKPAAIVSGGARGADSLGKKYADEHGIETKIFPAIWHPQGEAGPLDKGAGMKRNTDIIKEADAVLAFWDGDSTGTMDSISKSLIFKKHVKVVYLGLPQKKQADKDIYGFQGRYRWLSNMWPVEFEINGIKFVSSENAYQSSKYAGRRDIIEKIAKMHPFKSKSFVKDKANPWTTIDFDSKKIRFMRICLEKKFENPCLRQKLINTGGVYLEETNTWGDTFWGCCPQANGQNTLGRLLMELRDKFHAEEKAKQEVALLSSERQLERQEAIKDAGLTEEELYQTNIELAEAQNI